MRTGHFVLPLALSAFAPIAAAQSILVYDNNTIHGAAAQAALNVCAANTTVATTGNFNALLGGGGWDAVLVDCPSTIPSGGWGALTAFITGGGGVAMAFWDWDNNTGSGSAALNAAMGIATVPPELSLTGVSMEIGPGAGALFTGVTMPNANWHNHWADDGDPFVFTHPSSVSVATNGIAGPPIMVRANVHGGTTIAAPALDEAGDGWEVVTLWENMLNDVVAPGFPPCPPSPPPLLYDSATIPANFTDISGTGGTVDVTGLIANLDDGGLFVPIGFPFTFYGTTINSISFTTNGYLADDGSLTDFTNDCPIPSVNSPNRGIYPMWGDLRLNEHGSMLHNTLGAPGSQVFIAQWEDVGTFDTSAAHITMQVKIFEGCNDIEFHYDLLTSGPGFDATGAESTTGIEGAAGQGAEMIGCNTSGTLSTANGFHFFLTGTQQPRNATMFPPNPGTFAADPAGGPNIGSVWAPTVSGVLAAPALDAVIISLAPGFEAPTPFGVLLCNIVTPLLQFNFAPGTPFAINVPNDCSLVGQILCSQGGSVAFGPLTVGLSNGLDCRFGQQ